MTTKRKCVLNCTGEPKLFSFPKASDKYGKRELWLRLFGLEKKMPKLIFACERHFSEQMRCTNHLTKNAVPDINLPDLHSLRANPSDSMPHISYTEICQEAAILLNETEVQTDETVTDYIDINRKRLQKISNLKRILMQWKHEVKKLRLEKKKIIENGYFDNGRAIYQHNECIENDQIFDDTSAGSGDTILEDTKTTSIGVQTGDSSNKVCGLIEITLDKLCSLSCFYCSEQYPIWSWTQFITHINENHNNTEQACINDEDLEINGHKTKNCFTNVSQMSMPATVTENQEISEQISINDEFKDNSNSVQSFINVGEYESNTNNIINNNCTTNLPPINMIAIVTENHQIAKEISKNSDEFCNNDSITTIEIPQLNTIAPENVEILEHFFIINKDEFGSNISRTEESIPKVEKINAIAIDRSNEIITETILVENLDAQLFEEEVLVEMEQHSKDFEVQNEMMNEEFLEEEEESAQGTLDEETGEMSNRNGVQQANELANEKFLMVLESPHCGFEEQLGDISHGKGAQQSDEMSNEKFIMVLESTHGGFEEESREISHEYCVPQTGEMPNENFIMLLHSTHGTFEEQSGEISLENGAQQSNEMANNKFIMVLESTNGETEGQSREILHGNGGEQADEMANDKFMMVLESTNGETEGQSREILHGNGGQQADEMANDKFMMVLESTHGGFEEQSREVLHEKGSQHAGEMANEKFMMVLESTDGAFEQKSVEISHKNGLQQVDEIGNEKFIIELESTHGRFEQQSREISHGNCVQQTGKITIEKCIMDLESSQDTFDEETGEISQGNITQQASKIAIEKCIMDLESSQGTFDEESGEISQGNSVQQAGEITNEKYIMEIESIHGALEEQSGEISLGNGAQQANEMANIKFIMVPESTHGGIEDQSREISHGNGGQQADEMTNDKFMRGLKSTQDAFEEQSGEITQGNSVQQAGEIANEKCIMESESTRDAFEQKSGEISQRNSVQQAGEIANEKCIMESESTRDAFEQQSGQISHGNGAHKTDEMAIEKYLMELELTNGTFEEESEEISNGNGAHQAGEMASDKFLMDVEDIKGNTDDFSDSSDVYSNEQTICEAQQTKIKKMCIAETEPKIMTAFLDLLKSYPILWHVRLKSIESFDSAVSEVTEVVNSKWNYAITTAGMRRSLTLIKLWYRRRLEINMQDKEQKRQLKNKYKIIYFNKCAELEENSNKIILPCNLCDNVFIDEKQLVIHKHMAHPVVLPYKCPNCNMHFSHRSKLKSHEQIHTRKVEFQQFCEVCDKVFYYKSIYKRHLLKHKKEEEKKKRQEARYKCKICGKEFRTKDINRKHQLYHKPPKYKCEICAKPFYRQFILREHTRAHRNERNFICDRCGKAFIRQSDLRTHNATHATSKEHVCAICRMEFTVFNNLMRHCKTAHLVLEGRIEDLEMQSYYRKNVKVLCQKTRHFICKLCDIEFDRMKGLRDHNKMLHKYPIEKSIPKDEQQKEEYFDLEDILVSTEISEECEGIDNAQTEQTLKEKRGTITIDGNLVTYDEIVADNPVEYYCSAEFGN